MSKARLASAEGAKPLVGSEGMLHRKILKSSVSEMPFLALWGKNLQNSNGKKMTYNMSKFTCSLNRIIFQNVITGAVLSVLLTMQVYLLRDIYYSNILKNAWYTITSIY